jgi:hypothetical protein
MTTFAPDRDEGQPLREIDERTQDAWAVYRDSLRDLSGRDYDDAERRSWERLQRKLSELDAERAALSHTQTGASER